MAAAGGQLQAQPALVSVTPARGATGVPVTSSLVFTFSEDMDDAVPVLASFPPFLVGNVGSSPAGVTFGGAWTDLRTLTLEPTVPLPPSATITWTLNPAGSIFPFLSADGLPLPTTTGTFTTGEGGGGGDCNPNGVPDNWGSYAVSKSADYDQTSAADPVPATDVPFSFGVFVSSPTTGPSVTAGSITLPDARTEALAATFGFLVFSDEPASQAALDLAYPPGPYTLRFTPSGQAEQVVPMTMPATGVSLPKITNYPQAQQINPEQDFLLSWNPFESPGADGYISLAISDDQGNVLFQAPDLCVPRELPATAESIVIPADTLASNQTYRATLSFLRLFYYSTNAVPDMSGTGLVGRNTSFTLQTFPEGVTPADPARFTGYQLLPNGHPELTFSGTQGSSYSILRTEDVTAASWPTVGTATPNASGVGTFEDTDPALTFPAFYRAVAP